MRFTARSGWLFGAVLLASCFVAAPTAQQGLAERYAPLALDTPELPDFSRVRCAIVPPDPIGLSGFDPRHLDHDHFQPDGTPLRGRQVPRFIRPTQSRPFGFRDVLVLGDYETVTFERFDGWDEGAQDVRWKTETWRRATTRVVAGRLASIFHPRWPARLLRKRLRDMSWGVDWPDIYWGRLLLPDGATDVDELPVYLAMAPPDVPESPVVRINDHVQYASHVVNIRKPGFGDSLVHGGILDRNISDVTRTFYEHFVDEYETVAIVPEEYAFGGWGGMHDIIRNDVKGIGIREFDRSARWGSASVLQAIEGYQGDGGWATMSLLLHEQGHQWGDYTAVWSEMDPPLDRYGHNPDGHMPLLFPGPVAYGAVLYGDVQVRRVGGSGGKAGFEIRPTLPLVRYQPLTLYRMGLVPPEALPPIQVFRDQGQFEKNTVTSPRWGTAVTGETVTVTVNDLLAADGVRQGPVVRRIRRAVVYVSRGALATQAQMDVLNYFARRLGASSGVTSWDRHPSFREATRGRARMSTRIRPKQRPAAPASQEPARCAKVGRRALVGFVLDRPVGGCLRAGDTLHVSGRLTLEDRSDYDTVCFGFMRYPNTRDADRVFECAELRGNRFRLAARLPVAGGYMMRAFAFWPGSGGQDPLSNYTGAIEVLPR